MTDSPTLDERVEVMARAICSKIGDDCVDGRYFGDPAEGDDCAVERKDIEAYAEFNDFLLPEQWRAVAQSALAALESAGYIVAKPFWPPAEIVEAWRK